MIRTLSFLLLLLVLVLGGCSMEGEDCDPEDLECYCAVNPDNCQDEPAKTNDTQPQD